MTDDIHGRLLQILDEIRAIGQTGLNFSDNPYDRERYQRLVEIATADLSMISGIEKTRIAESFAAEIGYITPKVGVDAAVFNDQKRILLHRRTDDHRWCLPCGWIEVNESPAEAIVREVREETGLEVVPTHILGVYDLKADKLHPHHTITIFYLCRPTGGELAISHESTDIGYFSIDQVEKWHHAHDKKANDALQFLQKKTSLSAIAIDD